MADRVVKVVAGGKGWGGPLYLKAEGTRNVVASVTGGGIHPVAAKVAELLGVEAVDGFNTKVEPENMIVAVVDCGGTARCGVYPKLGVLTIDLHAITPSGPLMKFMHEDNFVSGVTVEQISMAEGTPAPKVEAPKAEPKKTSASEAKEIKDEAKKVVAERKAEEKNMGNTSGVQAVIGNLGRAVGKVIGAFYQAGRESIDITIKNVLPFMAFISMMIGLILYTGIGDVIAKAVVPLASNIVGMLILSVIAAIPFLSPVLGPGAVIAQVVGVLVGVEIGLGHIAPSMALPALFAINAQVGCDFVPVGLTLGEAEPKTVEIGVPAVLFSRLITGPISVVVAYLLSFGLY